MMRILLLLFITLTFVVSNGCGDGKKSARVADSSSSSSGERSRAPSPSAPGIDAGEKKDDETKKEDEAKEGDDKKEGEAKKKAPAKKKKRIKSRRAPRPSAGGGPSPDEEADDVPVTADDTKKKSRNDKKEEPKEEVWVSFLDRAHKSFAQGHEPEAFQYLYAHALADDEALREYPIGWYPGINRPRVGLRWGVGISYTASDSFEGDPPTIGTTVLSDDKKGRGKKKSGGGGGDFNIGGGGGNLSLGGGARGSGSSASNRGRSRNSNERPPAELLEYYTGEFGKKLVERYEMRRKHEEAFYGQYLKEVGSRATAVVAKEEKPKRSSGNGDDFVIAGSGSSLTPGGNNANKDEDAEYEAKKTGLAPGMMMLGVGKNKELLAKAKALNLDVFVHFVVNVKHTERRNADATTKTYTQMFVYKVKSPKDEWLASKKLNDYSVAKAMQSKRGGDPVEDELDKIFKENADKTMRAIPIPDKYTAEQFKKQFAILMKSDYENPLPVLVEMKNYAELGYITDNDFRSACEKYLGESETADLLDGDMKKREFALRRFLPGEFDFNVEVETSDFR